MASRKANFHVTLVVVSVVLFGIVIFFNAIVGSRNLARIDLTEDHIYTVSPAAKRILGELRVPVQVKFYITSRDAMPTALKTLEQDVVDKLREFEVASNGNLTFTILDPSQDEELAERILAKGIRPYQVQSIEKDEIGLKRVYSAMEIDYLDKEPEIIPQVLPQSLETLEYQICSAVVKLTRDKDPIVAVFGSRETLDPQMVQFYLQMGQQIPEPRDMFTQLPEALRSQNYDVRPIQLTEVSPIPEDTSLLMVLSPKGLSERQRYEINAFLQRGGSVIIGVQRYEYDYNPGRMGGFDISPKSVDTGIEALLEVYGLPVSDQLFFDNNMRVLSIPSTRNIGGLRLQVQEPVQKPVQILISEGQFNSDTSIANRVGELLFLWGNRLMPDETGLQDAGVEITPLFYSSNEAWELPNTGALLGPAQLTFDPEVATPRSTLGALLIGDLANAFEVGDIPTWGPSDSTTTGAVEAFEPVESRLIVVGCGKMFDDTGVQDPGNALFMLNCVDALTLGEDLIQVRAKTFTQRVIEPVGEEQKLGWRLFSTALVPILVAIYGIVRLIRRRRDQAVYLAAHEG